MCLACGGSVCGTVACTAGGAGLTLISIMYLSVLGYLRYLFLTKEGRKLLWGVSIGSVALVVSALISKFVLARLVSHPAALVISTLVFVVLALLIVINVVFYFAKDLKTAISMSLFWVLLLLTLDFSLSIGYNRHLFAVTQYFSLDSAPIAVILFLITYLSIPLLALLGYFGSQKIGHFYLKKGDSKFKMYKGR